MLSPEELNNVYFLLLSAYSGRPNSTAYIAVIAFFPYSDRECVKRNRALPIMVLVSSTHNRMNCEKAILSSWSRCSTNMLLFVCASLALVKAVTPKCLSSAPVDRDRLNVHSGLRVYFLILKYINLTV
ncbi:hypothetical protein TNCV_2495041 [Trichonephila clavipes]|nr:hypothetical protein TNCV_2495041 [Trichonephila clavipes]